MININGRNYSGNILCIAGGKITIDGKVQSSLEEYPEKEINIVINGNPENVQCDVGTITVNGNVAKGVKNTNGDINVTGDVGGDVKTTNGSIECGNVNGDVDTTNGNIRHRK